MDEVSYRFDAAELLTPALVIDSELVRHNIARMIDVLGGRYDRWRPHLKTVKAAEMMALLVEAKVTKAKCATTGELRAACEAGFRDVLVAFAHAGANAARVAQIAQEHREIRVSSLVEAPEQIASWVGTRVGLFLDINPGMDRTGIDRSRIESIAALAQRVCEAGVEFRGVHFYDGHSTEMDLEERTRAAHGRYDDLVAVIAAIEAKGIEVREVVTTGTPALPCALSYEPFTNGRFQHQVSPGTVVYNDLNSLRQLPAEYGLRPAVTVVSRVVSHPKAGVLTCDAGHKAVSVDSGVPNCAVVGHPDWTPMKPSEEHLPIGIPDGTQIPALGSLLSLIPRHVCPTVNLFDHAVLVKHGAEPSIAKVTARGHERPL